MDKVAIIKSIKKQVQSFVIPSVTQIALKADPYQILISCILSLRTKDKVTLEASARLFKVAPGPQDMVKLSLSKVEKLIYPVGFYRVKAKEIIEISRQIIKDFSGKVPNNREALLKFKGVGRKTANLVLGLSFGIPAICVDTHVQRIPNRLGWVKTKDPYETEVALEKMIPKREWIELNTLLVAFGQNICLPVSPYCSCCSVFKLCKKVGLRWPR